MLLSLRRISSWEVRDGWDEWDQWDALAVLPLELRKSLSRDAVSVAAICLLLNEFRSLDYGAFTAPNISRNISPSTSDLAAMVTGSISFWLKRDFSMACIG